MAYLKRWKNIYKIKIGKMGVCCSLVCSHVRFHKIVQIKLNRFRFYFFLCFFYVVCDKLYIFLHMYEVWYNWHKHTWDITWLDRKIYTKHPVIPKLYYSIRNVILFLS